MFNFDGFNFLFQAVLLSGLFVWLVLFFLGGFISSATAARMSLSGKYLALFRIVA